MIGKLTGFVDEQEEDFLLLDVNGVGYQVFASGRTLSTLPPKGEKIVLWIDTHVREDHIHLYGFFSLEEQSWFRLLTTVQGVGARMGLAILSTLGPDELIQAIAAQDRKALTRANGVGPKLGARIVAELKDKVSKFSLGSGATQPVTGGAAPAAKGAVPAGVDDAVAALEALGYGRSEAFAAVAEAARKFGADAKVEALIKAALQEMAR